FGYAITAVGDKILIGAHRDDTRGVDAGAAYLFSQSGQLLHSFYSPTAAAGDRLGISVAAGGSHQLRIRAHYDSTHATDAGAAFLYDADTGQLLHSFYSPNAHAGDKFGYAVASVGDNVLVGAFADDTAGKDSGAAYLFSQSGQLLQAFVSPTHQADAEFGW